MSGRKDETPQVDAPAAVDDRPTRVFLGNRSGRMLYTVSEDKGRAIHDDADDPRQIAEGEGLGDSDAGTVQLSGPADGKRATIVLIPAGDSLSTAFATITASGKGVWFNQIHDKEAKPAWVASDDPNLATLLSSNYGCPIREIDENEVEATFGPGHARGV